MRLWLKWHGKEAILSVTLIVAAAAASIWLGGYFVTTPKDLEVKAIAECKKAASKVVNFELEGQQLSVLPLGTNTPYVRRKGVMIVWKNLEGGSSVTCWVSRVRGRAFIENLEVNGADRQDLVMREER